MLKEWFTLSFIFGVKFLEVDTSQKGNIKKSFFLTSWTNTSQLIKVHPRAWITQRGQLTPRKFEIEEKMTTKQKIKKGKQHQLHVMSLSQSCQYARKFSVIGEPHVKYSSSLPQGNINYHAVTKSNLYEKHSLCMWTLPKKLISWTHEKQEKLVKTFNNTRNLWQHLHQCHMETLITSEALLHENQNWTTPAKALEAPHGDTNYLRGTEDNFWRI